MKVYYCYLEIFDEETQQWEYVANPNQLPEDLYYDQFFSDIDRESLFFFFKEMENQGELTLLTKWKGIPADASFSVTNNYYFYLENIKMCTDASYFYLNELFDFEYNLTIDLYKFPRHEYKNFKEYNYENKQINSQKHISFRNYLGDTFIEELNLLKRFERYGNCRIIYFVDADLNGWDDETIQPEPYFKRFDRAIVDKDITGDDYGRIETSNYRILTCFITKTATLENEEAVERQENLGIRVRDIFLNHLKKTIPIQDYEIHNARLTQQFWILEKIFVFGYYNGRVDDETVGYFCGNYPIFKSSLTSYESFTYGDDYEVDCGGYGFRSRFDFETFKLILRGFCEKFEFEIKIIFELFLKIPKTNNYKYLLKELEEKLSKRNSE